MKRHCFASTVVLLRALMDRGELDTQQGRIAVGYDADLTIVDLKRRETITNGWVKSKAGWTPYDGVAITGWPVGTFVRGAQVMWEGELAAPSRGEAVRFLETMPAA